MASVTVDGLRRDYGRGSQVGPISFTVGQGEFFSLLGPSGCGKSTTLRCIAGFERPDGGDIRIGGSSVTGLPPHRRNLGIVFQSFALFPHLDVRENVAFGLRRRRVPDAEITMRVGEALELAGLTAFGARFPAELSGGQQQRVAVARAIVLRPPLLLMDEPLSSLDLKMRVSMRVEIRALQRRLGLTVIYVTHDQDEALSMSDRVAVMAGGQVRQVGTAREIYDQPSTAEVATFIGTANVLTLDESGRTSDGLTLPGFRAGPVAIRPERVVVLGPGGVSPEHVFDAVVEEVQFLGADLEAVVRLAEGTRLTLSRKNGPGADALGTGQAVRIGFSTGDLIRLKP